jgi:hypothetical protein
MVLRKQDFQPQLTLLYSADDRRYYDCLHLLHLSYSDRVFLAIQRFQRHHLHVHRLLRCWHPRLLVLDFVGECPKGRKYRSTDVQS